MERGRRPRRAPGALLPLLAALGCAGAGPSADLPATPHAPGIATDPVFELPSASPSAETAGGIVVLAEPVNPEAARAAVDAFFDAVAEESEAELEQVLALGARTRTSAKSRPEGALSAWQLRWKKLDYRVLRGGPVYRPSTFEVYSPPSTAKSAERPLPLSGKKDEILVRVTVISGRFAGLLGTELVFAIACGTGSCRITEIVEDFRIP